MKNDGFVGWYDVAPLLQHVQCDLYAATWDGDPAVRVVFENETDMLQALEDIAEAHPNIYLTEIDPTGEWEIFVLTPPPVYRADPLFVLHQLQRNAEAALDTLR